MVEHLVLWGCYGSLENDHDVLVGHLPIFKRNDIFYTTLTPEWTLTESTLLELNSLDEAMNMGTSLKLDRTVMLKPGQIFAVMGHIYAEAVRRLGLPSGHFFEMDDWLSIQDAFRGRCTTRTELDEQWKYLTMQAKNIYDSEIRENKGRSVALRGHAALCILKTSPFLERYERFLRVASARLINDNENDYNRSLIIAETEFKCPFTELDQCVRSWIKRLSR